MRIHGKYCGPDLYTPQSGGGDPVDLLDELCLKHDVGYSKLGERGVNAYLYWNRADQLFLNQLYSNRYQLQHIPGFWVALSYFEKKKQWAPFDFTKYEYNDDDLEQYKRGENHLEKKSVEEKGEDMNHLPSNKRERIYRNNPLKRHKGMGRNVNVHLGSAISERKKVIVKPGFVKPRSLKSVSCKSPLVKVMHEEMTNFSVGTEGSQNWLCRQLLTPTILSAFLFSPRFFLHWQKSATGSTGATGFMGLVPEFWNTFNGNSGIKSIFALPSTIINQIGTMTAGPFSSGTVTTVTDTVAFRSTFFQGVLGVGYKTFYNLRNNSGTPVILKVYEIGLKQDRNCLTNIQVDLFNSMLTEAVGSYGRDTYSLAYGSDNTYSSASVAPGQGEIQNLAFNIEDCVGRSELFRNYYFRNKRIIRLEPGEECKFVVHRKFKKYELEKLVDRLSSVGYTVLTADGTTNHPADNSQLSGLSSGVLFNIKGVMGHDATTLTNVTTAKCSVDISEATYYSFNLKNSLELNIPSRYVGSFGAVSAFTQELEINPGTGTG